MQNTRRKQLDWLDPAGIQLRGITLQSADNYAGGGTALVEGTLLGSTAGERTALVAALQGVAINQNITPPVRRLSDADLFDGSETTRGIFAADFTVGAGGSYAGTGAVSTTANNLVVTVSGFGSQDYRLNRIRIRDAVSHDPIEDDNGNEVWGMLVKNLLGGDDGTEIGIVFYSGDHQGSPSPIDIKTLSWFLNPPANNTNGEIEIVLGESVEFRDIPFGHNLRDVMNFFDVAVDTSNLPITIYTDAASATVTLGTEVATGAGTTSVTVADSTIYSVGERIAIEDTPGSETFTTYIIEAIPDGTTLTVDAATGTGSLDLYHDLHKWDVSDPLLKAETTAGDSTVIEGYVNGIRYVVVRNDLDGTVTHLDNANTGSTAVESDFFADSASAGALQIWWLSLGWANANARFELSGTDEIYFTIHSK